MAARGYCFVDGDGLAGIDSEGEAEREEKHSGAGASNALLNTHDEDYDGGCRRFHIGQFDPVPKDSTLLPSCLGGDFPEGHVDPGC